MPAYPNDSSAAISAALGNLPTGTAVSAVAKAMLDYFTSGQIEPGTRLPPERQLAETLGIGRSAVREALAALEILGIVTVRPGSGTYLKGAASELLPQTLSWGMMLGEPRTRELIEVRGQLEVFAAQLAATRITDEELAQLEGHVKVMAATVDFPDRFIEADLLFHLQIAQSADNLVLLDLLTSIRSLLRIWVERGLRNSDDAQLAYEEHNRVFEAMRERDPEAVAEAMRYHMTTAGARLARSIDS
jgi:GntR family transcriptional regulator, transcriptional repressor for pyruvate dehydrogenase complex